MTVSCIGNFTAHPLSQRLAVTRSGHDEKKLLAAPATDQILFADHGLEDAGCFDQNIIARGVPPAVIHLLEVIDIDQQDRKFTLDPLCSGKLLLEERLGRAPVWDAGQHVYGGDFHQVISQTLTHHKNKTH